MIPVKKLGARVPRNFRLLAKQSFEKNNTRNVEMADTMDNFFDTNKIYIKSVQQEAMLRNKRQSGNEDPFYEDSVNKQMY